MIYVGQVFVRLANFKPKINRYSDEELEEEGRWSTSFANSQDVLAKLAEKARKDYLTGNTEKLEPDRL